MHLHGGYVPFAEAGLHLGHLHPGYPRIQYARTKIPVCLGDSTSDFYTRET